MAKIDLTIPSLGNKFIDLRDSIPGDSYNFSWTRPLSGVNYLAIHHSTAPDTQTPEQIANFHINNNGWGGIGYHFLIAKDGTVYYVGDITTARANVANLNDQVIGICLIGNFTAGRVPANEQLESAKSLCDFFINIFPDLPNIHGWEAVKGHKELPGQATACPGDRWGEWKNSLISGPDGGSPSGGGSSQLQIANLYRVILGRDPDESGLTTYAQGQMSIDQIAKSIFSSQEHKDLIEDGKEAQSLKSQVDGLQTTLASINQQVIILQETLQEREQEIALLRSRLEGNPVLAPEPQSPKADTTLTIFQALFNLYKFVFWPRKVA